MLYNDKRSFTSNGCVEKTVTYGIATWELLISEHNTGSDTKTMSEATGWTRGLNPRGFMTFQNMLRYQARFLSVVPNRRKNTTAKIGLSHWFDLMSKIAQNPADLHSFEVTVETMEEEEWATFQPGQKSVELASEMTWTSMRTTNGKVMRVSNKPRMRSLKKAFLFNDMLLCRVMFKSRLRLKYAMINLAAGNE